MCSMSHDYKQVNNDTVGHNAGDEAENNRTLPVPRIRGLRQRIAGNYGPAHRADTSMVRVVALNLTRTDFEAAYPAGARTPTPAAADTSNRR